MLREKLKVNRELTAKERELQLKQKERLPIPTEILYDNFSVIKFNSTYLETTDKYYEDRGSECGDGILKIMTSIVAIIVAIVIFSIANIRNDEHTNIVIIISFAMMIVGIVFGYSGIYAIKTDCFTYTHYPIRFNRKTKKVYAFLPSGEVITANWQDLFFTLGRHQDTKVKLANEDIKAHILAKDNKTILQSFELGICGIDDDVLTYWEFIRRYMEEGPKSVKDVVKFCLPIAEHKGGAKYELHYLFIHELYRTSYLSIFIGLIIFADIARLLAMKTCKIPHFPAEIEAESVVEANDPYIITPAINQAWNWKTGWVQHQVSYYTTAEYFLSPEMKNIMRRLGKIK